MIELIKVFRNYGCEYGVALVDYHGGMETYDFRVWILEGVDWNNADGEYRHGELFNHLKDNINIYRSNNWKALERTIEIFKSWNDEC
jgi:hypothetical protein